jgi:hypothetical protein
MYPSKGCPDNITFSFTPSTLPHVPLYNMSIQYNSFLYTQYTSTCSPLYDVQKILQVYTKYTFTCALLFQFRISHQYYSSVYTQYIPTYDAQISLRIYRKYYSSLFIQ